MRGSRSIARSIVLTFVALALPVLGCGTGTLGDAQNEDGVGGLGVGGDGVGGSLGSGASSNVGGTGAGGTQTSTGTNTSTNTNTGSATSTGTSSSTGTGSDTGTGTYVPPDGCTPDGIALINAINDYRSANGLNPVPASSSLCIVADAHVTDLADNAPHTVGSCNLHSWSDQGPWDECCYTPDHANASCMWSKPSELTPYPSAGYEISYGGSNSPQSAVTAWSNSSGHNAVILNQGSWANLNWQAIGAAQHSGYAHVWFGASADPAN